MYALDRFKWDLSVISNQIFYRSIHLYVQLWIKFSPEGGVYVYLANPTRFPPFL